MNEPKYKIDDVFYGGGEYETNNTRYRVLVIPQMYIIDAVLIARERITYNYTKKYLIKGKIVSETGVASEKDFERLYKSHETFIESISSILLEDFQTIIRLENKEKLRKVLGGKKSKKA